MRHEIRLFALVLILCMIVVAILPNQAQAGTTFGGDYIEATISTAPQEFRSFSAHFDAGEEVAFAVQGDTYDLFILSQAQFDVYNSTGRFTADWEGPAEKYIGSVQTGSWVFKAESADTYYLVIDNTVAGANEGQVEKSIVVGVIFPYSVNETSDLPGLSFILLAGGFILIAAVIAYLIGKRRKET